MGRPLRQKRLSMTHTFIDIFKHLLPSQINALKFFIKPLIFENGNTF